MSCDKLVVFFFVFFLSAKTISTLQRWSSRPRVWSSQWSSFSLSQQFYYSTQEAEKLPEEEPLHNIINDTESVQGGAKQSIAVVLLQYLISTVSMLFFSFVLQVASPNMNFRLRQKNYWILLLGHCIQRKRQVCVGVCDRNNPHFRKSLWFMICLSPPTRFLSGS